MKITGKQYQKEYQAQEDRGAFSLPPCGAYHVVNVALQRQEVGANETPKMEVWTRILGVVSVDDHAKEAEATEWVNEVFRQPLWWNLSKAGNANRVACMSIANGLSPTEEWDTESDSDCVHALTGTPYLIRFNVKRETWEGKESDRLNVLSTQLLDAATRKKYTSAPDWKRTAGDPAQRMKPKQDTKKSGKTNGKKQHSNDQTSTTDSDPFDTPF